MQTLGRTRLRPALGSLSGTIQGEGVRMNQLQPPGHPEAPPDHPEAEDPMKDVPFPHLRCRQQDKGSGMSA